MHPLCPPRASRMEPMLGDFWESRSKGTQPLPLSIVYLALESYCSCTVLQTCWTSKGKHTWVQTGRGPWIWEQVGLPSHQLGVVMRCGDSSSLSWFALAGGVSDNCALIREVTTADWFIERGHLEEKFLMCLWISGPHWQLFFPSLH